MAVIRAKLEPYLGLLHSVHYRKPSHICDLQELYRHIIDDFVRARYTSHKTWAETED